MKVQYNDQQGIQVREYTQEIHGDNYKELAKEFASHIPGGKILDEEKIEEPVEGIDTEIDEGKTLQDGGKPVPKKQGRPGKIKS